MINCFTESHIKQLQDVILFNKINILILKLLTCLRDLCTVQKYNVPCHVSLLN